MHRIYTIYQNWFLSGLGPFRQFFIYICPGLRHPAWLSFRIRLVPVSLSSSHPEGCPQYLIAWIPESNGRNSGASSALYCVTSLKFHNLLSLYYLSRGDNNSIYLIWPLPTKVRIIVPDKRKDLVNSHYHGGSAGSRLDSSLAPVLQTLPIPVPMGQSCQAVSHWAGGSMGARGPT